MVDTSSHSDQSSNEKSITDIDQNRNPFASLIFFLTFLKRGYTILSGYNILLIRNL